VKVDERGARGRLYALLPRLRSGDLDVPTFCSAFERIYNLELDRKELSDHETLVFSELFDRVVWFSPYAAERREIPNYLSEEEIVNAVDAAGTQLGLGRRSSALTG
jgi:hypothetical protein